jgi:hypothetical protein
MCLEEKRQSKKNNVETAGTCLRNDFYIALIAIFTI